MRSSLFQLALSAMAGIQSVMAMGPPPPLPPPDELDTAAFRMLNDPQSPSSGKATFDQYIDHKNPSLGTFPQTYWYNSTYWKGPGSPVVVFTPGEIAAAGYTNYLTDDRLTGMLAKEVGGAVVIVEHRYWGNSTPYAVQTTKNLQYLTLEQAVQDFARITRELKLPFDPKGTSNAPKAPWIWTGGSYSGALGAWIESLAPGTMWATHSSSGPLEAIYDYWQYFVPTQQGMPQNCSRDFSAIIDYTDRVLQHGSRKEKEDLKAMFNLQGLEHIDDIATAISAPIWAWQSIQMYSGYSVFYQMCDAIEGFGQNTSSISSTYPTIQGVGLKAALPNYAAWYKKAYLPGSCASYGYPEWSDENSVECFNTYNATSPMYTDYSESNSFYRTWVWMTCNDPFFYYQTGAPKNRASIFSRLVGPDYYQRQCPLFFPREGPFTFGSGRGETAQKLNAETGGWQFTGKNRLIHVNGEFDPRRSASVASEFRPGGPYKGTKNTPSTIIKGSRHCNDLSKKNGIYNSDIAASQKSTVEQIGKWTKEFYGHHGRRRSV